MELVVNTVVFVGIKDLLSQEDQDFHLYLKNLIHNLCQSLFKTIED